MSSSAATSQSTRLSSRVPSFASLPSSRPPVELEFRQIAGLVAGETTVLSPGLYDFGSDTADTVGFSLEVGDDYSITVIPGPSGTLLDSVRVWDPTPLHDRTINAGSARFRVGKGRVRHRDRREIIAGGAPQIHERPIAVEDPADARLAKPESSKAGPTGRTSKGNSRSTTFASFLSRSRRGEDGYPSGGADTQPSTSKFMNQVLETRADLADQRRNQHPDPEEIAWRASVGPALCWHRRSDHWHFAQVSIATADLPWQPHLDTPDQLGPSERALLEGVSKLPSVPVTADLRIGPLGIVGSKAATLACARHIMTSLATLCSPEYLAISVLASPGQRSSWDWAHRLPHTQIASGSAMPLLIIDGMEQLHDNGFGMALTEPGGVGAVLLARDVPSLPPTCATVMVLREDGTATIFNHRDGTTTSDATPHGISTGLAVETASHLSLADPSGTSK